MPQLLTALTVRKSRTSNPLRCFHDLHTLEEFSAEPSILLRQSLRRRAYALFASKQESANSFTHDPACAGSPSRSSSGAYQISDAQSILLGSVVVTLHPSELTDNALKPLSGLCNLLFKCDRSVVAHLAVNAICCSLAIGPLFLIPKSGKCVEHEFLPSSLGTQSRRIEPNERNGLKLESSILQPKQRRKLRIKIRVLEHTPCAPWWKIQMGILGTITPHPMPLSGVCVVLHAVSSADPWRRCYHEHRGRKYVKRNT